MPITSVKKAFIDSNVLIYSFKAEEARHAAAVDILDKLLREGSGVLSVQNLAEFCNVVSYRKNQVVDFEKIRLFCSHIRDAFDLVPYSGTTVLSSIEMSRQHGIHFFDALLAATMLENGIETIYTENTKDFDRIPGITAVNPFD